MSKNNSHGRRSSVKKDGVLKSSKENIDTYYSIQNENEILKLKNSQLQQKIATMKVQLVHLTSNLSREEQECDRLRKQIRITDLTEDVRLQGQKKAIQQKIQFTKGNCQIFIRKISEARESTVLEQAKIPNLKLQKNQLQRLLWQTKTQSEGTKLVLNNLQTQLQKQRAFNSELVLKRKQYGPKQSQISKVIEQKLRTIKNRENFCALITKEHSSQFNFLLLQKILFRKIKQTFLIIENVSYKRKIAQKQLFLLSLIQKKYLLFVKNKAMQKFRTNFRPLKQLQAVERIIINTIKRRIKNKMFRTWRSESNKREYIKIRYFECQATIQKFSQSYINTLLFLGFNHLKHFKSNAIHKRAALSIGSIYKSAENRSLNLFFSSLVELRNEHLKDLELQESANSHSSLLVLNIYFTNWAKLTKDSKSSNRFIKFKYFRELKKLIALKKKRDLSQVLAITHQKLKQIDTSSIAFCSMKKITCEGQIEALHQEKATLKDKNVNMLKSMSSYKENNQNMLNKFALLKIERHLKGKLQVAFNSWRAQNEKTRKLGLIANMLHTKLTNDINFGFSCIQRRRFQKLKVSIADKIESCEFSYNYLVQQNSHIKEVLDNKVLELQKSKFSNILRRLIRNEKQIKYKYFYKFIKCGYKCWKFKKIFQNVDYLVQHKIMEVFMFMLKQINKQKIRQTKIQCRIQNKQNNQQKRLLLLAFGVLQNTKMRNRKLKKIVENVFNRNMQLRIYNGYNKIKKIYTDYLQQNIENIKNQGQNRIKKANEQTQSTQNNIQMLRNRLDNKTNNIKNLIILACRKIFVKNSSTKVMTYFNKWRLKLKNEKKIKKFSQIIQRKTRILIKNKFIVNLIKKNGEQQVSQLKKRLNNYEKQLSDSTTQYDKYVEEAQIKMKNMQIQNQRYIQQGKILQKKTDHMDDVKVASFRIYWRKVIVAKAFLQWKKQTHSFIKKWEKIFNMLQIFTKNEAFKTLSSQMKNEAIKNRLRKNLSYIYAKKFRQNTGLAFKIWRITNLNKRIKDCKQAYQLEISNYQLVAGKQQKIIQFYDLSVNERINERKLRKIFDFLKKYTRLKIDNNKNKVELQKWLKRGYQIQFYRLFIKNTKQKIWKNKKSDQFFNSIPEKKMKQFFYKLAQIASKKKCIKKLFLNKFLNCKLQKLNQYFFSQTQMYSKYMFITKKNYKTFCIQKVLQTFDKKRKDILCKNMRKWRKNQFMMNIGINLFRKLTRKAICNRYMDLFYAWKLQSEAKKVLNYHFEQGEVKKRKVEIQRIQKFLHQFKKQKGLLLENQEGHFVMSPRFQKKKQDEEKKDKNLRYKFISRLLMSVNGYSAPMKAYNNLHIFMKLRQKYKKTAQFVLNHLRKPDMLLAFRTWRNATTKFRDDFQNMERKDLIKILNKQKDKMQIQYSHKVDMDEKIQVEMKRYKILSHQREKKQKLCALVLFRHAKRVKQFAFKQWRECNNQIKQYEGNSLARKGENRLSILQQQIRDLQETQYELQQSNKQLRDTIRQALQIADLIKKISQERDKLSQIINEKNLTCQSLIEENQMLNSKLHLAQKEAIRLLVISGEKP